MAHLERPTVRLVVPQPIKEKVVVPEAPKPEPSPAVVQKVLASKDKQLDKLRSILRRVIVMLQIKSQLLHEEGLEDDEEYMGTLEFIENACANAAITVPDPEYDNEEEG